MLSIKKSGIKYHLLRLGYDLTWDWTSVSGSLANTQIMALLYFYKNRFSIKQPSKVDMPLNKETLNSITTDLLYKDVFDIK